MLLRGEYAGVEQRGECGSGTHTHTLSEWYVTNRVRAGRRVRLHAFVTLGSLRDGLTLFQSPRLADAAASWICPRPWRGPSAEPRPPPGCRHSLFGEPRVHCFFYSRHPKNRGHGRTETELLKKIVLITRSVTRINVPIVTKSGRPGWCNRSLWLIVWYKSTSHWALLGNVKSPYVLLLFRLEVALF